jgi:hypothetical protein
MALHLFLIVIPAQAGRSAEREERSKNGPEGASEASHPVSSRRNRAFISPTLSPLDSGLRRNDELKIDALRYNRERHRP